MRFYPVLAGMLVAGIGMTTQAQAANLLVNGGFELTNNGFSQTVTPEGWTSIGPSNGVIAYSDFNTPPYQGSHYYDEGGFGNSADGPGDGIGQTVNTVAGQKYTLTFGLSMENVSGTETADVMIGNQLNQYTLVPNGLHNAFEELDAPFLTKTISYFATGSTTTIAFTTDANSLSFGNDDPMIDGVTFSSASAVPEPATWTMLLIGFGAVGRMLRSRRRTPGLAA